MLTTRYHLTELFVPLVPTRSSVAAVALYEECEFFIAFIS